MSPCFFSDEGFLLASPLHRSTGPDFIMWTLQAESLVVICSFKDAASELQSRNESPYVFLGSILEVVKMDIGSFEGAGGPE